MRSVLAALLLMLFWGAVAHACAVVMSSARGPWLHDDGWVMAHPSPWAEEIETRWLFTSYDLTGAVRDRWERTLDLEQGQGSPVHASADGRALFRIDCPEYLDEPASLSFSAAETDLCRQLVELTTDGALGRSWPLTNGARRVDGHGWWITDLVGGVLELVRVPGVPDRAGGEEWIGATRVFEFSRPDQQARRVRHPNWAMSPEGRLALTLEEQLDLRVLAFAPEGELELDSRYPLARPGRALDAGQREQALAVPWRLAVADDGRIALSSWQVHEDCTSGVPPSIVILGPDGNVQNRVPIEGSVESLAAFETNGSQVFALGTRGLFEVDFESGRTTHHPPEWEPWQEWDAEMDSLVSSLPTSGPVPELLLKRYGFFDDQDRRVERRIIERWPEGAHHLRASGWSELAPSLCREHGDGARSNLLSRFERSRGQKRVLWLSALMECFDEAPISVRQYIAEIAPHRTMPLRYQVDRAIERWGLGESPGSADRLDILQIE